MADFPPPDSDSDTDNYPELDGFHWEFLDTPTEYGITEVCLLCFQEWEFGHETSPEHQKLLAQVSTGAHACDLCASPLTDLTHALDHCWESLHKRRVVADIERMLELAAADSDSGEDLSAAFDSLAEETSFHAPRRSNRIHCELCHTSTSTQADMEAHLAGKQHQKRLDAARGSASPQNQQKLSKQHKDNPKYKKRRDSDEAPPREDSPPPPDFAPKASRPPRAPQTSPPDDRTRELLEFEQLRDEAEEAAMQANPWPQDDSPALRTSTSASRPDQSYEPKVNQLSTEAAAVVQRLTGHPQLWAGGSSASTSARGGKLAGNLVQELLAYELQQDEFDQSENTSYDYPSQDRQQGPKRRRGGGRGGRGRDSPEPRRQSPGKQQTSRPDRSQGDSDEEDEEVPLARHHRRKGGRKGPAAPAPEGPDNPRSPSLDDRDASYQEIKVEVVDNKEDTPYGCDVCNQTFNTPGQLQGHLATPRHKQNERNHMYKLISQSVSPRGRKNKGQRRANQLLYGNDAAPAGYRRNKHNPPEASNSDIQEDCVVRLDKLAYKMQSDTAESPEPGVTSASPIGQSVDSAAPVEFSKTVIEPMEELHSWLLKFTVSNPHKFFKLDLLGIKISTRQDGCFRLVTPTELITLHPQQSVAVRFEFHNPLPSQDGLYLAAVEFSLLSSAPEASTFCKVYQLRYKHTASERDYLKVLIPYQPPAPRSTFTSPPEHINKTYRGKKPEIGDGNGLEAIIPLGNYHIPSAYFAGEDSLSVHQGLIRDAPTPAARLHALLYAEEFRLIEEISAYTLRNEQMEPVEGEPGFWRLTVPGLAEKRPSVLRGDKFVVNYSAKSLTGIKFFGYVHKVELTTVVVDFHKDFDGSQLVDVYFVPSRLPLRRCHQAIDKAYDYSVRWIEDMKQNPPEESDPVNPSQVLPDWPLNEEQRLAIANIISGSYFPAPYVVFGPPGTGKTRTISHAILALAQNPKTKILACAPSNAAADELAKRLLDLRLTRREIFRFNAISRVLPRDPGDLETLWTINDGESILRRCQQARIVVVTCVTSGQLYAAGLQSLQFSHLFFDEASQCTEAEFLVPLQLCTPATRLIMAGDHKQLGPVVLSPITKMMGLSISKLEQMMAEETKYALYQRQEGKYNAKYITKLVKNYRSHKDLLALPSRMFYDDELTANAAPEVTNTFLGWDKLPNKQIPLIFHGVSGEDERENTSPSWFNFAETNCILDYMAMLLQELKISPRDIGIITPYLKQKQKIRLGVRQEFGDEVADSTVVGSVEELQGQERPVIIISTVRSNAAAGPSFDEKFALGFLRDPKRFNVAITRAQALLIVIGNPNVLHADPHWGELVKLSKDLGVFAGVQPVENVSVRDLLSALLPSNQPTTTAPVDPANE